MLRRCCHGCRLSMFHCKEKINIPMKSMTMNIILQHGLALINFTQVYINTESDSIECEYSISLKKEGVITGLNVLMPDGTKIIGAIEEKEKAKERYSDSISEGNSAVLTDSKSNKELTLLIGNLLPNSSLLVEFSYSIPMLSEITSWVFSFPIESLSIKSSNQIAIDIFIEIISETLIEDIESNLSIQ